MVKFDLEVEMADFLNKLGIEKENYGTSNWNFYKTRGELLISYSPIAGKEIAGVGQAKKDDYESLMDHASAVFTRWRALTAPERGEIIR